MIDGSRPGGAVRRPLTYLVRRGETGEWHYVVVGAYGEVMSIGENVASRHAARARATDAWIAHIRSTLGHWDADETRLLAEHPLPWSRRREDVTAH